MNRCLLLCMCLFGSYLISAQVKTAEMLFNRGKYQRAAVAYERAFYETREPHYLLRKVYCYKSLKDYEAALRTATRINTGNDSLEALVLYEKVLLNFLDSNYPEAYNDLLRYEVFGYPKDFNTEYVRFVSQVHLLEWESAKRQLFQDSMYFDLSEDEIEYIIPADLKIKEIKKARTLSYFLPGVGQMYAGYFGKGLISGTMVAGAIAFTAYSTLNGYFFTGMVPGAAVFYTFYLGGVRYAGQLAEQKNREMAEATEDRFREVLNKKS